MSTVATWISLLRAINLGSRNQVSMPALRRALEADGFCDVRTHLQSGNVVAESVHRSPAKVAESVNAVVKQEFGLDVPVIVRTAEQLRHVVEANPFPEAARERPKILHVSFLAAIPAAAGVQTLVDHELTRQVCRVEGDNLYIDYVDGVHTSKLTSAFFARRLGVDGTARNWRTVLALVELTGWG
ncbi:MAG: DUF1697 domain-containing protein [Nocardioidaceae bacterium]